MTFVSKILASGAIFATATVFASAQTAPGSNEPSSPIQYVSNEQFNRMAESGELQLAGPRQLEDQFLDQLFADLRNHAAIDDYLREHRDLRGLRDKIYSMPNNPNVFLTRDGNYRTEIPDSQGNPMTIEFMGQPVKLSMLAGSIRAVSDPARQLALYENFFTQYGNLYRQFCVPTTYEPSKANAVGAGNNGVCANLPPPSTLTDPATLTGASLETIQGALGAIGANATDVLKTVPLPSGVLTCLLNSGASTVADNVVFGDQTHTNGCTTPSAGGVLKNVNWVNKNLISPVKNQGARGTCHIFASTSAMEELVARDTSCIVNLAEEDFMENEKLIWGPAYYGDGGDPETDLNNAHSHKYKFAYEKEWDYNPSLYQPGPPAYEYQNSCEGYPYPSLEPGCSDSAPQAPEWCTVLNFFGATITLCGFTPAVVPGPRSPYMSDGVNDLWNPANPGLSFDYIILALAFNDAVILGFNVSPDFEYGAPGGYIKYDPADIANTKAYLGSHVVHVVGYVSNSDLAANPNTAGAPAGEGGGYFIIKNSWGACAGDAGYYYMPVQYLLDTAWGVYAMSSESH
jgi:hypothetical protein